MVFVLIMIRVIRVNKFRGRATPRVCPSFASLHILSTTALFPALSALLLKMRRLGSRGIYPLTTQVGDRGCGGDVWRVWPTDVLDLLCTHRAGV